MVLRAYLCPMPITVIAFGYRVTMRYKIAKLDEGKHFAKIKNIGGQHVTKLSIPRQGDIQTGAPMSKWGYNYSEIEPETSNRMCVH